MLTIGQLAARTSTTPDTLRYYEKECLISPDSKSEGGYRLYRVEAAQRVAFIKHAQQCGFTLAEIRDLLALRAEPSSCCSDIRARTIEKKLQLEAKINVIESMVLDLDKLIDQCANENRPLEDCPILKALDQEMTRPNRRVKP